MNRKDGKPKSRPTYGITPAVRAAASADLPTLRDAIEHQSHKAMTLYRQIMVEPRRPAC